MESSKRKSLDSANNYVEPALDIFVENELYKIKRNESSDSKSYN